MHLPLTHATGSRGAHFFTGQPTLPMSSQSLAAPASQDLARGWVLQLQQQLLLPLSTYISREATQSSFLVQRCASWIGSALVFVAFLLAVSVLSVRLGSSGSESLAALSHAVRPLARTSQTSSVRIMLASIATTDTYFFALIVEQIDDTLLR